MNCPDLLGSTSLSWLKASPGFQGEKGGGEKGAMGSLVKGGQGRREGRGKTIQESV